MKSEPKDILKDVENILKSVAESKSIKNYEIFPDPNLIRGDGFLSEFFTGEILNKDNCKKIQVAIKKAPVGGFTTESEIEEIYKNEINFYSKVFPELDKYQKEKMVKYPFDHIPRYLAGNTDSNNLFLAMENIKSAGYRLYNKKKYLDKAHIELIFKTYGKLHALSFSFKQKRTEEYENLTKILGNLLKKFFDNGDMVKLVKKCYLTAVDTFDPVTEAEILTKLETIKNVTEVVQGLLTYKGAHNCLIHGDCWSNNMLFKYKESGELEDIKLIDFQVSYSSTPIQDLSYFFYSGASKEDMDKLDDYLDLYYQSFSEFARELGENPEVMFPLDALKKEWKEYGLFGILMGCQLWFIKLMDRDEVEDMLDEKDVPPSEYINLVEKRMTNILAREDYRERVRNICLHAVEYGIL